MHRVTFIHVYEFFLSSISNEQRPTLRLVSSSLSYIRVWCYLCLRARQLCGACTFALLIPYKLYGTCGPPRTTLDTLHTCRRLLSVLRRRGRAASGFCQTVHPPDDHVGRSRRSVLFRPPPGDQSSHDSLSDVDSPGCRQAAWLPAAHRMSVTLLHARQHPSCSAW